MWQPRVDSGGNWVDGITRLKSLSLAHTPDETAGDFKQPDAGVGELGEGVVSVVVYIFDLGYAVPDHRVLISSRCFCLTQNS